MVTKTRFEQKSKSPANIASQTKEGRTKSGTKITLVSRGDMMWLCLEVFKGVERREGKDLSGRKERRKIKSSR